MWESYFIHNSLGIQAGKTRKSLLNEYNSWYQDNLTVSNRVGDTKRYHESIHAFYQKFIIFWGGGGECLMLNIPCINPLLQVKLVYYSKT